MMPSSKARRTCRGPLFTQRRRRGILRSSGTSYYASSIMLGAPRRGPLTPPKSHELNLLVTSDGGLVRISPRDRVALQDAHLRRGVRLIARNRSGRRDETGAPMALVSEGYRAALDAGLLDGVSVTSGAELHLHLPRVRALLPCLAFEPPPVRFVDEALRDSSAELLLLFAPDDARAGELGSRATLDLQRDLPGRSSGVGTLSLRGFEPSHSHHGLPSPCNYCGFSSAHHNTRSRPPYMVVRIFRRVRSDLGRGRFLHPLHWLPVFCGLLGTAVEGGED